MTQRILVSSFVCSSMAVAQVITFAVPQPVTASAVAGAAAQSVVQAAGSVGNNGVLFAQAGNTPGQSVSQAQWRWNTYADEFVVVIRLAVSCNALDPGLAQAIVAPGEMLVDLSLPTTVPVIVSIQRALTVSAGAPAPIGRVDIGDDGSVEFDAAGGGFVQSFAATLSPQPLRLRLQAGVALASSGTSALELEIVVRPELQLGVTSAISGCGITGYEVGPSFDGDLVVRSVPQPGYLAVAVFGLGWQALQVNPANPLPCLLLPTLDLVQLVPPTTGTVSLTIPPAARPLTLWTQGVELSPFGSLATTGGFLVNAF